MTIHKKPTTNIFTACVALSLFFLLWRTFGFAEHTGHAGSYHPTSMFLAKTHLQTRQIKPQTLPKSKVAHPLLNGGLQSRKPAANPQDVQAQPESSPKVERDSTTMTTIAEVQPQSVPGTQLGVQSGVESQEPMRVVTCSQDMSLPCLPGR